MSTLKYKLETRGYGLSLKKKKKEKAVGGGGRGSNWRSDLWYHRCPDKSCLVQVAPYLPPCAHYPAAITITILSFSAFNFFLPLQASIMIFFSFGNTTKTICLKSQ